MENRIARLEQQVEYIVKRMEKIEAQMKALKPPVQEPPRTRMPAYNPKVNYEDDPFIKRLQEREYLDDFPETNRAKTKGDEEQQKGG